MAADSFSVDDTESAERWDSCWNALTSLPGRNLSVAALRTEAAQIVNSCRASTEGRGIEHLEERARVAHRLATDQFTHSSGEQLSRFTVVLSAARSVLRRASREAAR
jgi:hypothetical protein